MSDKTDMRKPVQLILDTDMGNDIDDALALAMIHALQSRGECELAGVVSSKDNCYSAAYIDAINTFYHRGYIPVGRVVNGVTPEDGTFTRQVVELKNESDGFLFSRTTTGLTAYPDAVSLLRRQLASAEDLSVVIVMIGFSTNMAQLLESGADDCSELDGRTLIQRKVKHVVMMAAEFSPEILADPTQKKPEFNIRFDISGARSFITKCPCPIYFSGLEVGSSILYSGASITTDYCWCARHPVVEAYIRCFPMPYDRPTWDLTAVLFAVWPDREYFGLSDPGVVEVDSEGFVRFRPQTGGLHRYLTVNDEQRARICEIQTLLTSQPHHI